MYTLRIIEGENKIQSLRHVNREEKGKITPNPTALERQTGRILKGHCNKKMLFHLYGKKIFCLILAITQIFDYSFKSFLV